MIVYADPLPAPCSDCGRIIDWPARYVFNVGGGGAHLDCVENRARRGHARYGVVGQWIARLWWRAR